ncbi:MAG: peptidylprolyl isomerase [Polyangiaceae bacterium]|jgi:peptidyl-prolyl cis-trans isomerase A (cyclophilin A)
MTRGQLAWLLPGMVALAACATRAPDPPPPVTLYLPLALPDPTATVRLEKGPPAALPARAVTPDRRALLDPALAVAKAPEVYRARFRTTQGDFVVEVHRAWAPNGADRFYNLVHAGFYDGTRFFRAIAGFMVQWGISGDPAVSAAWHQAHLEDDPHVRSNTRGTMSFAKTGAPDSATTQVFVSYGDNSRLDALRYTPFGEVVEGMSALDGFYKGYGEGEPGGKGPSQGRMEKEGDAYLDGFPLLDRVLDARVEE